MTEFLPPTSVRGGRMSRDNPWIMRRLGLWPQNRNCSECSHFEPGGVSDRERFEGAGRCVCNKNGVRERLIVGSHFSACEFFKSHWQADRELLERLGQKRVEFATRGGG